MDITCHSLSSTTELHISNSSKWGYHEDITYSNYLVERIENSKAINYDALRSYSLNSLKIFDADERDELFKTLNNGVSILTNNAQTDMYNNSYGNMHKFKLIDAYNNLPEIDRDSFLTIIDYGCGQGIGTLILLDKLKEISKVDNVKTIILVEPSKTALSRAVTTLKYYNIQNNTSINVISVNKLINNLSENDIMYTTNVCIHVLSNILDLAEVNNSYLLNAINGSNIFNSKDIFVCVGPKFTRNGTDGKSVKFRSFANSIGGKKISENYTNLKYWTRQHIIIER